MEKPTRPVPLHQHSRLSPRKMIAFWTVLILIPTATLFIIEVVLRLANYEGNLELVVKKQIKGKEYYSINRSVATRYFAHSGTVIPEPADDIFEVEKSKNTVRIFCLGESTMAGFPFEFNATAPSFLKDRLKAEMPDYNFEVINVGLSAVSSYVVLDFLKELSDYQPDAFIVYAGHNEFYGAYGVGSTVGLGGNYLLTNLNISLLKFKTFLALRNLVAWIGGLFANEKITQSSTLMAEMISNQSIGYRSEAYTTARDAYRRNIVAMISIARDHRIPIMFSTLVSNLRDHPPFRSEFSPATGPEKQTIWKTMIEKGDSSLAKKRYQKAIEFYSAAVAIDSTSAMGFYKLGVAFDRAREIPKARRAFLRAKDLDVLRFRATEEFQSDLLSTCGLLGIPVARVDSVFASASPDGIIGKELMLEHLHPNISGYFLMGNTFAETIKHHLLFNAQQRTSPVNEKELVECSYVTEFDTLVGKIRTELLTHRWPFVATPDNFRFTPTSELEKLAYSYIQGRIDWSEARYQLAEVYALDHEFDKARRECLAVSKVIPYSYQPLLRVADYYRREGKLHEAVTAYKRCIEVEDNPFARFKLAIVLLEKEHPDSAAQQLEQVFTLAEQQPNSLTVDASATARYLLGVAYAKMGKYGQARDNLQRALGFDPNYVDAKDLLRQLDTLQRHSPSHK